MLTKKDAIAVGKAMIAGAAAEKENCFNRQDEVYAIQGATHRMLNNLWYDVFPSKVKEAFGFDVQNFVDEVWK